MTWPVGCSSSRPAPRWTRHFAELGCTLGEELLRPTLIYVPEILEIIEQITSGQGVDQYNRRRAAEPAAGRGRDRVRDRQPAAAAADLFGLIEKLGAVSRAEMFEVYNMGVGFCVIVAEADVDATLAILARHGRRASVIGSCHRRPDKIGLPTARKPRGQRQKFRPA